MTEKLISRYKMMRPTEKCLKILKTCSLYLSFITVGLYSAILGPCLLDLSDLVNADEQHIGIIFTGKSIGFLVGSILSGMILDATRHKQCIMIACNTVASATILAIPWSTSLGILTACLVVCSICTAILQAGGSALCLKLWGDASGPYIHALFFVLGLGALLAPLIAAPFLKDRFSDTVSNDVNNLTDATIFESTYSYTSAIPNAYNITSKQDTSMIVYPFSIIGLYSLFVSVISLFVYIISPTEVEGQYMINEQNSEHKLRFIVIILVLDFLLIFLASGIEIGYSQMLTTYVVNGYLKLHTSVGSYMTSIFWIASTLSRFAAVVLAIKLSHFKIIIISLIVISVGALILVFLAYYEWAIWLSSILLGAGTGPMLPAAIGWLGLYITVSNRIAAFLGSAISISNMVVPLTIGYFIGTFPDVFIYFTLAASISCYLIFLSLFVNLRKREIKK